MTSEANSISRVLICRSNPVAPDPRVTKAADALAGAGYPLTILGWDRAGNLPKRRTLAAENRIRYMRLFIPSDYAPGHENLRALLRWQWGLFIWLIKNRKEYEIIHACNFDTALPALYLLGRLGL